MFEYEIGGKVYVQRPLVLGQVRQLMGLLREIKIPAGAGAAEVIALLDEKLPEALAVVLTEKGKNPKDKDIQALAEALEFEITPEVALKVVEDFFSCNPIASVLQRLTQIVETVKERLRVTGLKNSSASLREATSPGERRSSGDTPSGSANPT